MNDITKAVKIEKIVSETPCHKTFYFNYSIENFKPGQFLMVWLPRVDEKPMSASYYNNGVVGITVEQKGEFTKKMFELKEGDFIGIRGSYGNGFSIRKNACIIGGGCGIAPISPLIELSKDAIVILGARSKELLLFTDKFKNAKFCTDNRSFGEKGFVTDILRKVLKEKKPSIVQCCGPEIMMKKVFEICEENNIECEASLERYCKCGFGICGQCSVDEYLICKDGPIFSSEKLRRMKEFGNYARLKSGKKVSLGVYYGAK